MGGFVCAGIDFFGGGGGCAGGILCIFDGGSGCVPICVPSYNGCTPPPPVCITPLPSVCAPICTPVCTPSPNVCTPSACLPSGCVPSTCVPYNTNDMCQYNCIPSCCNFDCSSCCTNDCCSCCSCCCNSKRPKTPKTSGSRGSRSTISNGACTSGLSAGFLCGAAQFLHGGKGKTSASALGVLPTMGKSKILGCFCESKNLIGQKQRMSEMSPNESLLREKSGKEGECINGLGTCGVSCFSNLGGTGYGFKPGGSVGHFSGGSTVPGNEDFSNDTGVPWSHIEHVEAPDYPENDEAKPAPSAPEPEVVHIDDTERKSNLPPLKPLEKVDDVKDNSTVIHTADPKGGLPTKKDEDKDKPKKKSILDSLAELDPSKYQPKFIDQKADFLQAGGAGQKVELQPLKQMNIVQHGGMAEGGLPDHYKSAAPKGHHPEFITGVTGYYACGGGTGQSDDIPAMLHDGDYVMDAETVSALGDGSSKAGMHVLDGFREKVPHHDKPGSNPVPAKIADGEYVFPAAFVTSLGGGDNKQGAKILDGLREKLRAHKRGAPTDKIPPKAKSPLDYIKKGKE